MGGRMSRNKGAAGEREVFKILNDELGLDLKRNLDQYQGADSDLHIYGFCAEIKRQETLSLKSWWEQVVTIARRERELPVLIYRQSRQPWRVVLPLAQFSPMFAEEINDDYISHPKWVLDFEYTATILLQPMFTTVLREVMVNQTYKEMEEKSIDTTH
jgi:Holliday junction resolvase